MGRVSCTIKDNLMGNVKIEPQQRELVSLLLDRHEIAAQMDPTGNFASTLQARSTSYVRQETTSSL